MRKFALALIAASAAIFGFGMVASAQTGYTPAVEIVSNPAPSAPYTVVYRNCVVGDTVTFSQPESTPTSLTAPCVAVSAPAVTGSVLGVLLPQQAVIGRATATFSAAPSASGTYTGRALGQQSPEQAFVVTVVNVESDAEAATTVAPAAAVPVTVPGGGLPATGSDGIGTTTGVALGLLVVGLGLFVVAQVRRRQQPSVA